MEEEPPTSSQSDVEKSDGSSTDNQKIQSKLQCAIEEGALHEIITLIDNGVDINLQNEDGCTPLHIAIANKNEEIFKLLITNGANVNASNKEQETPLHYAIFKKQLDMCKILLQNGAKVDATADWYGTPLATAIKSELFDIAKLLIENGANVNEVDPRAHYARSTQGTLLHWAARHNETNAIKFLVENGADVNASERDGRTALCLLAKHDGSIENFDYLLEHGADPNNKSGNTPLFWITYMNYGRDTKLYLLKHLIEKGADANISDEYGFTPLHSTQCLPFVQTFVESGADVNAKKFECEQTALHTTSKLSVLKYLVGKGADIHVRDSEGSTPLHYAAGLRIAEFLVEKGADIHAINNTGYTPLHLAKSVSIAEFLIEKGANLNALGKNGRSVLHSVAEADICYAPDDNKPELVDYFIDKGIDIDIKDFNGDTPLHVCVESYNYEAAKRLLARGANFTIPNHDNKLPLDGSMLQHIRAIFADMQENKTLNILEKGRRTQDLYFSTPEDKSTFLHYAVRNGTYHTVQRLLMKLTHHQHLNKNYVNMCDIQQWTPLHCAANAGTDDIVRLLLRYGALYDARTKSSQSPADLTVDDEMKVLFSKIDNLFRYVKSSEYKEVSKCIEEEKDIIDARDSIGKNCLHWAIEKGDKATIELLINSAVDTAAITGENVTTLHIAAFKQDAATLEILLQTLGRLKLTQKVIDIKTTNGDTALHIAAKNSSLECVKLLLLHGATYNSKNKEYRIPCDVCIDPDTVKLLKLLHKLFQYAEDGKPEINDELGAMELDDFKVFVNARSNEGLTLQQTLESNDYFNVAASLSSTISSLPPVINYKKNKANNYTENQESMGDSDVDVGFELFGELF